MFDDTMYEIHHELLDIPLYDEPKKAEPVETVRTQQEESAYRRYTPGDFPQPFTQCITCHEVVWTDQGHMIVKPVDWDDEKDLFLQVHHDDCYKGDGEVVQKFKRTAKLELDT